MMPSSRTAAIGGRVVRADTGEPIRRALVKAAASEPHAAWTDDDGRYEIVGLPAGRYQLTATKGGYVDMQYGQRRPFRAGRSLTVADGQRLERIDFALPPGGVIAGRILDEAGELVAGASVSITRQGYFNGRRQLVPAGWDRTDDRGEFRAFGLAPGDYYVVASLEQPDELSGGVGYAPTYFPGTPALGEAQRVTLDAGQELAGITFSLAPARMASVSGVVRTTDGTPLSLGMVVVHRDPSGIDATTAQTAAGIVRPDGSFVVSNVSPGTYLVDATSLDRSSTVSGTTRVTVNGVDISGVVLEIGRSATARGRIGFDTGAPPADVAPNQVRVFPMAAEHDDMFFHRVMPEPTRDDWTFEITGLGGSKLLRAAVLPESEWTLKSVHVDGVDVTDTPIDFRTSDVEGIEVVFTRQITELSGVVTDGRGTTVTDATVVAFVDDREKWTPNTRFIQSFRVDQNGRFTLRGLPPETYVVVALDDLEPGEETDPELLERLTTTGARVTLRDGETRALDLRIAN